ncbi:40S ribosomal protein S5-1 [Hordeum vulgare]|nr:40S ribosomal protein S5-1 [Hordeum vulgare]
MSYPSRATTFENNVSFFTDSEEELQYGGGIIFRTSDNFSWKRDIIKRSVLSRLSYRCSLDYDIDMKTFIVINPYLTGVLQHPQSIEMREGVLHIRDVEGPKKTGSMEARLEAMEQHVFKCQGMVERGLNANHIMITEFTSKHKIDANDIGKHLSRLYDRIDHLQAQIYDLQNKNCKENFKCHIVVLVVDRT